MAQGDLIESLMDVLATDLNNQADKLYLHNMRAQLGVAIRSSNAQFHDPEFLNRLEVKLLQPQPGERGWEIFQLSYNVSDKTPLTTIFTPQIIEAYARIFHFLWKLKKIEHMLSISWATTMSNRKEFQRITEGNFQAKFHKFCLVQQEMSHFVRNVFNYILVEVLESAWREFLDGMKTATDLDALILLQKKFISSVQDKALLSQNQKKMYRKVLLILSKIFVFTHIKDDYFL
jgi:gamma-tubulin complex component 3